MRVKMSKQPPPAPTASAVGPCPTVIQIVGRPGTGSLTSTIAPPDLDIIEAEKKIMKCTYMVKHTSSIPLVLLYIKLLILMVADLCHLVLCEKTKWHRPATIYIKLATNRVQNKS